MGRKFEGSPESPPLWIRTIDDDPHPSHGVGEERRVLVNKVARKW